jgi:outer membrane protein assembly factor BamB
VRNTGATTARGPTDAVTVAWRYKPHLSSRKAPVVADGDLYVGSFDETTVFASLDAATGDEQWRTDLGDDMDGQFPDSAAAIVDDLVLAGFGEHLFAFERETGEIRWQAVFEGGVNAPLITAGTGYVTLTGAGSVLAFDPTTGDTMWHQDVGQWCPGPVAVADGTVYTVTVWENDTGSLVALDAATGSEQWRYDNDKPLAGSPAVVDDVIFVGDARGVHAVTTAGDRRWRFQGRPLEDHEWSNWTYHASSPAVADGSVYIGAADERVYSLDVDSGEREWAFWTWNNVTGAPVVTPDTVYVGSDDTVIYALDVDSGDRRWEFATTGGIDGAGGAVVDGRLYISTFQDGLYALEER